MPTEQLTHAPAPDTPTYVPAAQLEQALAEPPEYVPATQLLHADDRADPVLPELVPAEQPTQAVAPAPAW